MTAASSAIKKTAKKSLKINFVKSILVSIVVIFCYLINNNIGSVFYLIGGDALATAIFLILNLFMLSPIFFGALRYFWRLLCGVADSPLSVFYYFTSKEKYKKLLKIVFNLGIRAAIWLLILHIPYFLVSLISNVKIYEFLDITAPLWTVNLSNLNTEIFFRSLAIIGTLVLMLKYYLAPMLFVADENMDVNEALHMSVVVSKNTLFDFVYLVFSMLGWILVSLLFIPLIYTLPLFVTVYFTHCSYAVAEYNEHIKKINNENFPTFMAGI